MNINILRFDSLESTNAEAARQAKQGADEGLCVMARKQTAGRGRHGRTWVSKKGDGLYFSIVLRPTIEMRFLPLITLMAGVAVHDTLKEFGIKPDIKWVNDLLVREKKICGILAETVETSKKLCVIVGIGINITSRNFPDDIAETATSIESETGKRLSPDNIAEKLTGYLSYFYGLLCESGGAKRIIDHWRKRSSYFNGKTVSAMLEHGVIKGITDGLEENGALRVKTSDGSVKIIQAGDVERLREVHPPW